MTVLWPEILQSFTGICGEAFVYTDPEQLYPYERDGTLHLQYAFDVLLKPGTAEEIAAIMHLCNQHGIPVTPRGGGSGVTGGALPHQGGVVVSLERLNRILSIHRTDGYVLAESGVVTAALCQAVEQEGLYFPVIPSSQAYCFVGGNVAENAGSIYSCKYGTTAQYVLNLEVVLPTGEIIWTGANVPKNATGLNLTQLFVGSEGTLGIITKVVYRLLPKPARQIVLLTAFSSVQRACEAVNAIKHAWVSPAAVELITSQALRFTAAYLDQPLPLLEESVQAHLLIELHEVNTAVMEAALEALTSLLEPFTTQPMLVAESEAEKEVLRKLRLSIGSAMTGYGMTYRDIDTSVPLSFLYSFITGVEAICQQWEVPLLCFGHALDGNLHTMLLITSTLDQHEAAQLEQAVGAIYRLAIQYGGVLSGEHGIGLLQKPFMPDQFSDIQLGLMKKIKHMLDPQAILNAGKVF